jgi:hypothetical protein
VTWKIIEIHKILGFLASMEVGRMYITGYAEDAGAIFMSVHYGIGGRVVGPYHLRSAPPPPLPSTGKPSPTPLGPSLATR